jgi:hypothetical protein
MADANGSEKKSIDERLDALTMNLELVWHTTEERGRQTDVRMDKLMAAVEKLVEVSNRDAIDIAALARIAESHERRLENLEG